MNLKFCAHGLRNKIKHITCPFKNSHKFVRCWYMRFHDFGGHGFNIFVHELRFVLLCPVQFCSRVTKQTLAPTGCDYAYYQDQFEDSQMCL